MRIKKNKSEYWFKAKNYGWGWYPSSWQGWLVTLVFIILIVGGFNFTDSVFDFIPHEIILVILLIAICYKTGEKPEWRWGGKKIK